MVAYRQRAFVAQNLNRQGPEGRLGDFGLEQQAAVLDLLPELGQRTAQRIVGLCLDDLSVEGHIVLRGRVEPPGGWVAIGAMVSW